MATANTVIHSFLWNLAQRRKSMNARRVPPDFARYREVVTRGDCEIDLRQIDCVSRKTLDGCDSMASIFSTDNGFASQ